MAFLLLILILGIAGLYVYLRQDSLLPTLCGPLLEKARAGCEQKEPLVGTEPERRPETLPPPKPTAPTEQERQWAEATGALPRWPEGLSLPGDCRAASGEFRALCLELDARPYIQAWRLEGGTHGFLTRAFRDLMNKPPGVSGELLKLESLLANVFHVFRALGAQRTERLREVLRREQALAEPVALITYRWLMAQAGCPDGEADISLPTLYEYAAFLLNSMGGQGYLRRRTPRMAALGHYYALVILDEAMRRGINHHGVDPRPHIQTCRALINGQGLLFEDRYLGVLQEIEGRWQGR